MLVTRAATLGLGGSSCCCYCLLLLGLPGRLWALPLGSSGEVAFEGLAAADDGARLNLEPLSIRSRGSPWQAVPGLLWAQTDGSPSKAGLGRNSFTPRDSGKEVLFRGPARNSLLSHMLGKERKQDKRRGSLSECFWKYCV